MTSLAFRVHPTIGIARVGQSPEYYLAPETAAGKPVDDQGETGGLPVMPGTDGQSIRSSYLRDADRRLKKQAARFRIYAYPDTSAGKYPAPGATEVTIGATVGGKVVTDIVWTVHLANKKANCFRINEALGLEAYEAGNVPPLRNVPDWRDHTDDMGRSKDPDATRRTAEDPTRRRQLIIDAGPRALAGTSGGRSHFDLATGASYADDSGAITAVDYPKTFPSSSGLDLYLPTGQDITTLGAIEVERNTGRLIVVPADGLAIGWKTDGADPTLPSDINNDQWFDDTADGPVNAIVLFDDGSAVAASGAWVVSTDPAYAPQTLNVVSTWDDVFDTWVRNFDLKPELYKDGKYNESYKPSFEDDVFTIFRAAALQRWNTNLPSQAIAGHDYVDRITFKDAPKRKIPNFEKLFRNPAVHEQLSEGAPLMPLSLGDAGRSFLTVSPTQYFFLEQWYAGRASPGSDPSLGFGEHLDRVTLMNCLGGRYNPGIEFTYIVRDPHLYDADWHRCGAFRIRHAPLDYGRLDATAPVLGLGYVPRQTTGGCEPGDICKFMAIPWHTDYNSCATHTPPPTLEPGSTSMPVPDASVNTLYWSWPSQRPVAVYSVADVHFDSQTNQWAVGKQRFSVRGPGTESGDPKNQGRYQERMGFIKNWNSIGVIVQGSAIDGGNEYGPGLYLEVESLFDDEGQNVEPWPTATPNPVTPPENPSS